MSTESLTGKRVVLTGSASGIGAATLQRLLDGGAEVYSLDRNDLDPVDMGRVARHITVDLADPRSIDSALQQVPDGHLDALLNVAGVPGTAPGEVVFSVNSLATRHIAEALLDRLSPGGAIVIVSSSAGIGWPSRLESIKDVLATDSYEQGLQWFRDHRPEGNAYTFSKEVTTVYAHLMGLGLGEVGVRINAVLPGPVETPILVDFEETMGKELLDGVRDLVGRHATPDDIAKVILFLASDDSGWVTGQALAVDGGVTGALATGLFPAPEI